MSATRLDEILEEHRISIKEQADAAKLADLQRRYGDGPTPKG